jgi:hypothetical protein
VYLLYLVLILLFGMINESRMLFVLLPLLLACLHGALGPNPSYSSVSTR